MILIKPNTTSLTLFGFADITCKPEVWTQIFVEGIHNNISNPILNAAYKIKCFLFASYNQLHLICKVRKKIKVIKALADSKLESWNYKYRRTVLQGAPEK